MSSKNGTAIFGTGGFGRETLCCLLDVLASKSESAQDTVCFVVDDNVYKEKIVMGIPVFPLSQFDSELYDIVVSIGDPSTRKGVVERLPKNATFATIIHPTAVIGEEVVLGVGSIVTAGSIITCNIKIGNHAHLNLLTTIGHDCSIGDYFTTAPGAKISGECKFGESVYFGTNACVRQGVTIVDNVTIGMGGVVVKNVMSEGVYIGNPLVKLDKN